jgi:hypothetical protein
MSLPPFAGVGTGLTVVEGAHTASDRPPCVAEPVRRELRFG